MLQCFIMRSHQVKFRVNIIREAIFITCIIVMNICVESTWGEIVGSKHDFSAKGWSGNRICQPCHTPHNADIPDHGPSWAHGPLWNHASSTQVYTIYSSPSMDYEAQQPGPVSKLCLSCHDGTVAIDSFDGMSGSSFMSGKSAIGRSGNLSDDHPIGIVWRHQTARPTCVNNCHLGVPRKVVFFAPGYTLECASCHEPHNNPDLGNKMLRVSMVGSELCFQCHTNI